MTKTNNASAWIEEGYILFAHEGLAGIQIERLARILNLNKSGFYHYFGNLDSFYDELLKLHEKKADDYLIAVAEAKTIDPDYFHVLITFKDAVMFHSQLTRMQNNPSSIAVMQKIDKRGDVLVRQMWSSYLGVEDNPDLAMRYFSIVRDMFYTRISFKNYNEQFLRNLLGEARAVINELTQRDTELEGESQF